VILPELIVSVQQNGTLPLVKLYSLRGLCESTGTKWIGTKLHQLLETCQDCQCSDPRDKVYALLGFADDCDAENIVVDYSKSVFGVFEDVVKFLLSPGDEHLDPRDSIRFIQNLQRIFGARADMDRGMEQAEKEVQPRPKSFIRAAGSCEGSVRRTSRGFDRPDVVIALLKLESRDLGGP
jgi:hypothetical protein